MGMTRDLKKPDSIRGVYQTSEGARNWSTAISKVAPSRHKYIRKSGEQDL